MWLRTIAIFFIFGFPGEYQDLNAADAVPHGDGRNLDTTLGSLRNRFGSPDLVKEKIMSDGAVFLTLYYAQADVSYVADVKRNLVCEITSGMHEKGYCYSCDYEPGVC